jgi:hypothetical protein
MARGPATSFSSSATSIFGSASALTIAWRTSSAERPGRIRQFTLATALCGSAFFA